MTRTCIRLALAPVSLMLLCGSAFGQDSAIERCKQTSSESERIACLEAALLGEEPQAKPQEVVAAPVEPEEQIDPPSMEIETGPADDSAAPAAAATAAIATTAAIPEAPPPAGTQPTGLGAEQVIAKTQSEEERQQEQRKSEGMVIAKYEWVPYERLVVYFENGQVWRQIKGDRNKIRTSLERNQTADITQSAMSGYTLRLNEMRRSIRVERIR